MLRPQALPLLFAVLAIAPVLSAQGVPGGTPAPATAESAVVVDSASPRAALRAFQAAVRANDLTRATTYLDLSAVAVRDRAPELARRLDVLLDSRLHLDVEQVSADAHGDLADGLARDRELLGRIPGEAGRQVPLAMTRTVRDGATRWLFAAATVAEVDALYGALPDAWVRENLPEALRRSGPFGLQWWQWLALVTLIPLAIIVGLLLAAPAQALLRRLVSKTETSLDDALVDSARGPIVLLIAVATSALLLRWIALPGAAEVVVRELQRAFAVVAIFWVILRVIGVLQEALPATAWASSHPALRSLVPLGSRIARLLVIVAGMLTVISSFGYPIATILAGLGIGGIAVAFGAQKTLEHFFGSVSIGIDQPFRVGDWIIVDGVEGEVEAIGLRSSRIRTLERTVVSIPNGRLADMRSENFGPRDRIRLRAEIGLEYSTTSAQVAAVRDGIEAMLRGHPMTWPGRVVVRFFRFAPSSIDLEIFCWIVTGDVDEFRRVREAHYLGIMRIVEQAGARFAYPTQTVQLRKETGDG
jgi:MscS family membrane protein